MIVQSLLFRLSRNDVSRGILWHLSRSPASLLSFLSLISFSFPALLAFAQLLILSPIGSRLACGHPVSRKNSTAFDPQTNVRSCPRKPPLAQHPDSGKRRYLSPLAPRILAAAALSALLAACAGSPQTDSRSRTAGGSDDSLQIPADTGADTIFTPLLQQSQSLIDAGQLYAAASILSSLHYHKLTGTERARWVFQQTAIDEQLGNTERALERLQATLPALPQDVSRPLELKTLELMQARQGAFAAATAAEQMRAAEHRAMEATGRRSIPVSGKPLAQESTLFQTKITAFIWSALQHSPLESLESALPTAQGQWRAWLELALLDADLLESPEGQHSQLMLWQQRYPDHPTRALLASDLHYDMNTENRSYGSDDTQLASRAALLLPLGQDDDAARDANHILDGYLAASYEAQKRGWPTQELLIIDTADFENFTSAVSTARKAGATWIIGPIEGDNSTQSDPTASALPTDITQIALSQLRPDRDLSDPVIPQFSVSLADDMQALAGIAYDDSHRRSLLLYPDNIWGYQASDALTAHWQGAGGELTAVSQYSGQKDYASALTAALGVDSSKARYKRVRQLLGEPAEFYPRRRQDIDSVFLLSDTAQHARALKPLLAFHYAGDLPVYGSAEMINEKNDRQRDRDLSGIQILLSPWRLYTNAPLQTALASSQRNGGLNDRQALGVDVFALQGRLKQLGAGAIRGSQGVLVSDETGRIRRYRQRAVIKDGAPTPQ